MTYRIQTFYPPAGCFMDTNHKSEDLEQLKHLARSDTFAGFRIHIVDETDALRFAPPVRERRGEPTAADIATMLDVPVLPLSDENDEDDNA